MTSDRARRWAAAMLAAAALAAGVALSLTRLLAPAGLDLAAAFRSEPLATAGALAAPLVAALVAAQIAASGRRPAGAVAPPPSAVAGASERPRAGDAALQLLALLQQEGRFVDFLEEDLSAYTDEQIGSAVRSIHEGCRAALKDRLELVPVLPGAEGATVTVERGFDPAAVRVTGNVRGEPPYRGVLRHPGWRSAALTLPERTGDRDPSILAPAEVEIV